MMMMMVMVDCDGMVVCSDSLSHLVLKSNSTLKLIPNEGHEEEELSPIGWDFTPANRRVVMETFLPNHDVVLRFSGQVVRRPHHYCQAIGVIR